MNNSFFNRVAILFALLAIGLTLKAADPTPSLSPSTLLSSVPAVGTWFRIEAATSNGNANNRNVYLYAATEGLTGYFIQPDATKVNTGRTNSGANTHEDGFLWTLETASSGKFYLKNKLGFYAHFTSLSNGSISSFSKTTKTEFSVLSALFSGSTMFGFQYAANLNLSCNANTAATGVCTLNVDGGNPSGSGAKANAFWLHSVTTKSVSVVSNDLSLGTVVVKKDRMIELKYNSTLPNDITQSSQFDHYSYQSGDPGNDLLLTVTKGINNPVTVVASAIEGSEFSGWVKTSDLSTIISTETSFTYSGTVSESFKAIFVAPSATTKVVAVVASDGGAVSINGTAEASKEVSVTASVTVVATPLSGYLFEKWVNATDGAETILASTLQYVYSGESDITLKAIFKSLSSVSRTVTVSTEMGGSVAIVGTTELSKIETADQLIVVNAIAANGFKFSKWVDATTLLDVATTASYSYAGIVDLGLKAVFVKTNGHTELQFSTAANPVWYTINPYYSTNTSSKWNVLSYYDEINSRWIAKGQSNTTTATATFTEMDASLWRLEGSATECYLVNKATGLKVTNPVSASSTQRFTLTEVGTPFSIGKSNSLLASMETDAFYFDPIDAAFSAVGRLNIDGLSGEMTLFKNGTADITGGKASSLVFVPVVTKRVSVVSAYPVRGSVTIHCDSVPKTYANNRFFFEASALKESGSTVVRATKNPTIIEANALLYNVFEKWTNADDVTVSTDSIFVSYSTSDELLTAHFGSPISLNEQSSGVKVWVEQGIVCVSGTSSFVVTNLSGVRMSQEQRLSRGIYFVTFDGVTHKVIVQ